jgi:hypothetical protein
VIPSADQFFLKKEKVYIASLLIFVKAIGRISQPKIKNHGKSIPTDINTSIAVPLGKIISVGGVEWLIHAELMALNPGLDSRTNFH